MPLFRNLGVVARNLLVRRGSATPPRASSSALTLRKIGIRLVNGCFTAYFPAVYIGAE
jgi:hypothetical protein